MVAVGWSRWELFWEWNILQRPLVRGGRTRTIWATNAYVPGISYPLAERLRSSRGIQLGCSSSVRAWSIWSLGVRRHGGRGHRLTLAGERFVGLASEDAAAFSIFFPMD
jgi:hypothetical protein